MGVFNFFIILVVLVSIWIVVFDIKQKEKIPGFYIKYCSCILILFMVFSSVIISKNINWEEEFDDNSYGIQSYKDFASRSQNTGQSDFDANASISDTIPSPGSIIYLIVTGPPGGNVRAICQYPGHSEPYIITLDNSGKVVLPIRVGNEKSGIMVPIEVTVSYKGQFKNIFISFKIK